MWSVVGCARAVSREGVGCLRSGKASVGWGLGAGRASKWRCCGVGDWRFGVDDSSVPKFDGWWCGVCELHFGAGEVSMLVLCGWWSFGVAIGLSVGVNIPVRVSVFCVNAYVN